METESTGCPDCGLVFDLDDNYCRACGMYLAALHASLKPVATEQAPRDLQVVRSHSAGLPQPVKRMATAIVVGSALQVGLGLGKRYLAAQGARKAAEAVSRGGRRGRAVQPANAVPEETEAVSETLVIRRVWMKRG